MRSVDLEDIARRPQRYWDVDGLPELVMGLLWMLWGAAWLFGQTVPRDWRWAAYWSAVPAALALSGAAAVAAIKALKRRLTFPRTGYIDWNPPTRAARGGTALVAVVTAMLLVIAVVRGGPRLEQSAVPIVAVILSLSFVVVSLRQRAPHYLALAGVAVALGLAFASRSGGWASVNWLFLAIGAASAMVGGIRLAMFLQQHPRPEADA